MFLFFEGAGVALLGNLCEEVVAFVVDEDEGGKIFDIDFPDGFHAEFGVFEELDFLDGVLGEDGSGTADGAEVEAAVLVAGVGDLFRAVALGNHNHGAAMALEEVDVGVHAAGGRGAERARGHAFGSLGGTGVVDGMVLEVLGHGFAAVEAFLDFGMGYVAAHDDGAVEREACRDGVFGELGKDFVHGAVEVDFDNVAFALAAHRFGDEFGGVGVEFFNPQTFAVDFGLDVAVGRAADAEAHGAGSAMAREADHADVVGEIFAAELGAEAEFLAALLKLFFEFDVAESVSEFVALGGKRVVVFHRSLLDGFEVFLGRGAADDKSDVVGRTCCGAERLHFLDEERKEGVGVEQGLGLLIEICLIGRAAAFGHEEEVVFIVLGGVDVDLGGEVAAGVDLVVHGQGSVLRVAEIVGGIGVVDAVRNHFGIVAAGEHILAFFGVADGCARVLAEGELAFGGDIGVAEHGESDKLVVFGSFGVGEDFGDHGIVFATEHEGIVVGALACEDAESFRLDHEKFVTAPVLDFDIVGGEVVVLGGVGTEGEHFLILEGFCGHK